MKNFIYVSIVLVILLLSFTGCKKTDPPLPPPVTYTITTKINGSGIVIPDNVSGVNLGRDLTFKIIPEAGYSIYSIKINGTLVEFQPSASETYYAVKDIKSNLNIEFTFVETNILTFSVKSTDEKPWYLTTVNVHKASDGSFVRGVSLYPQEKTDRYYYLYPSMKAVALEEDGGVREGTWDLKQTTLTIDGHNYPLWELTSKKFSYQSETVWSNFEQYDIFYVLNFERK